jgi:hypothetical protein
MLSDAIGATVKPHPVMQRLCDVTTVQEQLMRLRPVSRWHMGDVQHGVRIYDIVRHDADSRVLRPRSDLASAEKSGFLLVRTQFLAAFNPGKTQDRNGIIAVLDEPDYHCGVIDLNNYQRMRIFGLVVASTASLVFQGWS